MHPISIFLLGIAMSTDAFAAAVGKGAAMHKPRFPEALRAGVIFGTIEGLTPVIGWLLGMAAAKYVTAWDHWIAFTLLGLLGLHMIYAGLKPESEGRATDAQALDRAALLAFYDFPAERWIHIRRSNVIESSFATVRHRTDRTKGCLTRDGMLAMIYKLGLCAERSWRRLRGFEWLAKSVDGVKFHDGVEVQT